MGRWNAIASCAAGLALALATSVACQAQVPSEKEIEQMKAASPDKARVQPARPRKVLVFNLCKGFKHSSVPFGSKALEVMGAKTGAFETVVSEDIGMFAPDKLAAFDAVVMNNTTGELFDGPREAELKKSLMDFVKGGKGIVGIHAATDCFYKWEDYGRMMGGYFSGHPWNEKVGVKLDEPNHPLNAAFKGQGFDVADEIYQFRDPYSRKELRVLLSLDLARTDMKKGGINRKDGDFAVAWCRSWGQGRVYYNSLGHRHEIFWNPPILQAYLDGIQFACGDLKAQTDPVEAPKAQAGADPRLADALKAVATYTFGQSHQPLNTLEEIALAAAKDETARKAVAKAMADLLAGQATDDGKSFLCRQLWVVGGEESVPALAGLLGHEKLSDMARYALERMAQPAAGAALREAVGKVRGPQLVGVLNSLGQRRDVQADHAIAILMGNADEAVAVAAAKALGKIATESAAAALSAARTRGSPAMTAAIADSLLNCGEALAAAGKKEQAASLFESLAKDQPLHVQLAALHGLLAIKPQQGTARVLAMLASEDPRQAAMAGRFVRDIPGAEATRAFVDQLAKLSAPAQVMLLDALAGRGDAAALPALVQAATDSKEPAVRLAGLRALAELGDASTVPALCKVAASSAEAAEKNQARDSLTLLKGKDVDAAIVEAMKGADEKVQAELIRVLTARRAVGVEQALLGAIAGAAPAVQAEAIRALGVLGNQQALPPLASALVKTQDDAVRDAAEKAIGSVALRVGDAGKTAPPVLAALKDASGPARSALVRAAGRIAGPDSLAAVRAALKDANADVADAALRAIADWPDADALADARDLAANAKEERHRILALRGFVRMAAMKGDASADQRVAMYQDAMKLAARVDDKKMVLAAIGQAKDPAALKLVEPCLDDEALAAEACAAAVAVAQAGIAADAEATKAVLAKVAKAARDPGVRDAAGRILSAADKFADFVVAWEVSGPYTKDGADPFETAFAPEQGGKADWKPMPAGPADRPWLLELDKNLGGDNRAGYLRTALYSPKTQDVMLECGSDDGVKVWIEGKLVHANNAVRPCVPGQDRVKVTLKEGWNAVLMKVAQGGGEWQACLRFRTVEGGKVEGLRASPKGKAVSLRPVEAMLGMVTLQALADEPADTIMGEYAGSLTAGNAAAEALARCIAEGKGNYRLVVLVPGDKPRRIELTGTVKDGQVELAGPDGWTGKIADGKALASGKDMKFEGKLTERKSPTLGAKPPEGAVVLLPFEEGKEPSLEAWQNKKWKPMPDGSMEVSGGNNKTVKSFGDCQLHVEFRCPLEPEKRGQGRGNSGVYLQDRYEIQVLDSFGLDSRNNDCGGIYGVGAPKVNACLPPLQWQTYDITFRAPRFDAAGKMIEKPKFVKVLHNGVLIHENMEVGGSTTAAGSGGHAPTGPLHLQDHGNKVRYRNIWLVETK